MRDALASLPDVTDLLRLTFRDPRRAARTLLEAGVPGEARWLGFALVVVLTAAITQLAVLGLPDPAGSPFEAMMRNPVSGAVAQGGMLLLIVVGMSAVARWFGGTGSFSDALLLASWIEFVLVILQAVQLVIAFAVPFLALVIGLASVAIFFWLLTYFTAELNGFSRPVLVFVGIIATLFAAAFVAMILFGGLGMVPGPPPV
jgi:hypothetical protein